MTEHGVQIIVKSNSNQLVWFVNGLARFQFQKLMQFSWMFREPRSSSLRPSPLALDLTFSSGSFWWFWLHRTNERGTPEVVMLAWLLGGEYRRCAHWKLGHQRTYFWQMFFRIRIFLVPKLWCIGSITLTKTNLFFLCSKQFKNGIVRRNWLEGGISEHLRNCA